MPYAGLKFRPRLGQAGQPSLPLIEYTVPFRPAQQAALARQSLHSKIEDQQGQTG
jgi:hypothetical protein